VIKINLEYFFLTKTSDETFFTLARSVRQKGRGQHVAIRANETLAVDRQ
jgi:hypothetical protein